MGRQETKLMEVFEGSFRGASRLPVAITMIKKAVSRRENFSMGKRFSTPGYSLVSLGEVFFFFLIMFRLYSKIS